MKWALNHALAGAHTTNVAGMQHTKLLATLGHEAFKARHIGTFTNQCIRTALKALPKIDGLQFAIVGKKQERIQHHKGHHRPALKTLHRRLLRMNSKNLSTQALLLKEPHIWSKDDSLQASDSNWYSKRNIHHILTIPLIHKSIGSSLLLAYGQQKEGLNAQTIDFLTALHILIQWCRNKIRREKEVRLSDEKYIELFHTHPHASFLFDLKQQKLINANRKAREKYGYSTEEFLSGGLMELWAPNKHSELPKHIHVESLRNIPSPVEHRTKNGQTLYIDLFINPIRYRGQDLLLIQAHDISGRIAAHHKQEKLNKVLSTRNEELQRFAYIVSHNLRAPIVNQSSLLKMLDKTKIGNKDNQLIIQNLESSVRKIEETLTDLLDVVSLRKESTALKTENIDLHQLKNSILKQISEQLRTSKAHIRTYFEINKIHQPRQIIESLFLNMLTNALKYCSRARTPEIDIYSQRHANGIMLCFSDNGLGMDLRRCGDQLFGLYQRFHPQVATGRGLGLYLVHTQIKAIGGHIEVDSKPNIGTTFRVYLQK